MKFINQISGVPGSGKPKTVFVNGTVTDDMSTAQFFMKMQDEDKTVEEARSYAEIGPMIMSNANWDEIKRVLNTF